MTCKDCAYGITYNEYWLECKKCYAASKERRTLRGAIKEWNKIRKGENQ